MDGSLKQRNLSGGHSPLLPPNSRRSIAEQEKLSLRAIKKEHATSPVQKEGTGVSSPRPNSILAVALDCSLEIVPGGQRNA